MIEKTEHEWAWRGRHDLNWHEPFALQKIHFSNARFWRKADIGCMTALRPNRTFPAIRTCFNYMRNRPR